MATRRTKRPDRAKQAPSQTAISILYEELAASRDRLAGLGPLRRGDIELVEQALHEVVWYFLTPSRNVSTTLALPSTVKAQLVRTARNRTLDVFVSAVALFALKLGTVDRVKRRSSNVDRISDLLDELAFDDFQSKQETITLLRALKSEIDSRITFVKNTRRKTLRLEGVETYSTRTNKKERPDQFFKRVYARHLPRGLTQADIRREDPAFYNVFHVWCSRNRRRMDSFVPAALKRRS